MMPASPGHRRWNGQFNRPPAIWLDPTPHEVGEKVSIDGWIAKDGSKRLNAKSVTLSNGRELFAGSSFFEMRNASDDDGS